MTIIFKWYTGRAVIEADVLLNMPIAQMCAIIKTATENGEEAKAELAAYIRAEIATLNPKNYDAKQRIEYLKKRLSAFESRKATKQEKAIQRIVDNVADSRPDFHGMFKSGGKYCVCDGYRAIRSSTAFYGVENVDNGFDVSKAIGNISAYSVRLALPSVKDLKSDIKIAKLGGVDVGHVHIKRIGRRKEFQYDFGYGLPVVDANYLVDMLEAMPNCGAFCVHGNLTAPIYFVGGELDGILLPIRKVAEWEEQPAEEVKEEPAPGKAAPIDNDAQQAVKRVVAVAIAVNDGAHDLKAIVDYLHMYGNDMITEDEAKDALMRYTVPLALPAHEEAAQDTAAPEIIQIAAVIHPAVLRRSGRHYRQLSARRRITAYHTEPDIAAHVSIMNNAFFLNSS